MPKLLLPCFVTLLGLSGCGADAPAPPPPPLAPAPPQATILDDQLRALERARSVEATVQESKDRTDAALEESENN